VESESFVEPMMALAVRELPEGGNWNYEIKFDGYRALALKSGSELQLLSRNRTSFTKNYLDLIESLKRLSARSVTIDGEIVALDPDGRPSFQLLQNYGRASEAPLVYYAFDLLFLEGKDFRAWPLIERRKLLAKLLEKTPSNFRFSQGLAGDKKAQSARKFQLEGLTAKKADSTYESGRRTGAWVKVQACPGTRICDLRVHATGRQPGILWRSAN
jgi:bifunctional non-homologous end joining protein LigD